MTDRLDRDVLVELRDQYSSVYPLSPSGARGWVRAKRELPKFDPEVYIEWDKTHWRYHGERDGWTFEHHFRLVDDRLPDEPQDEGDPILNPSPENNFHRMIADAQPSMEDILAEAHRKVEGERCPHCGDLHDEGDEFFNGLMEAHEAALESDGFLMISLTPRRENGLIFYEPAVFMQTLSPTAQGVIESQITYLAAALLEQFTLDRLNRGQDEPGR